MEDVDLTELYNSTKDKHTYKRASTYVVLALLGSVGWLAFSFYEVMTFRKETYQLQGKNSELERERDQLIEQKNDLKSEIDRLKGIRDALVPEGKRREAIKLALDLQDRRIEYKPSGKKPEDGGLDLSGFITYVLSQPNIRLVEHPGYCAQDCLMNRSGITKASSLSELKQGDLIFYDLDITMMYLGNNKCIGMLWDQGIQVRDVYFGKIRGYGKVPYGD